MNKNEWSSDMLFMLKMLHISGLPFTEIAEKMAATFGLHLTKNACIGKARRIGLMTRNGAPRKTDTTPTKRRKKLRRLKVDAPIAPKIRQPRHNEPGIDIYQLREDTCRWPLGHAHARPPYRYCGEPAEIGRPYCDKHRRTATAQGRLLLHSL
jgi:hypothetical protein